MGDIVLAGSTSGTTTLTPAAVSGTTTLTLPATTGTVLTTGSTFGGTGPAFSAYANASQSVTGNVFTKVVFQAESFDTASCFDSTTNYRFTPTVAGYYQLNAMVVLVGTVTTTQLAVSIYKNGASTERLIDISPSASLSANGNTGVYGLTILYLNGSTDYVEIYGYYYLGTATFSLTASTYTSRFSGSLVRAA